MANQHSGKTTKTTKNTRPVRNHSAAGWLLLLFIASGCMFYLGVMVGRNTAPVHFDLNSMEKNLNNLQQSVLAENTASTKKIENKLNENMPFDFYDNVKGQFAEAPLPQQDKDANIKRPLYPKPPLSTLTLAKATGVVTPMPEKPKETQPPAAQPAQKPETAPATTVAQTAPETTPAAPKPEAQPSPPTIQTPQAAQAPTPSPAAPKGRQYAIQVASLKDAKSAGIIRDKFRSKGYPAYTQEAVVEGRGQWYRVRIGPYDNRSQAENDLARLQKAGVDAILFLSDAATNSSSASQGKQ